MESLKDKNLEPSQLDILWERDLFSNEKLKKYKASISEKNITLIHELRNKGEEFTRADLKNILLNILSVDDVNAILKLSPQSDAEFEKEFQSIWNEIMDDIDYTPPRTSERVASEVQQALIEHVKNNGYQGHLLAKLNEIPLEKWVNSIIESVQKAHYSDLKEKSRLKAFCKRKGNFYWHYKKIPNN